MKIHAVFLLAAVLSAPALADELTIEMSEVDSGGVKDVIGTITVTDTAYGALFTPDLKGLRPGLHGFHIHENPSCEPADKDGEPVAALAAGGHFDPFGSGRHEGPYGAGHLGDLPPLTADAFTRATHPVLAPRVNSANLRGRALIIHEHGDNYADEPKPLGGGGARFACGVIED
ncbi:MAG TPA: superoxide dismutase [Cu-Zn] SodC [Arenicellales bacterium]|nr:superoxide dismutase [Cu-Zn] SodC [Arenicellales bacterium]